MIKLIAGPMATLSTQSFRRLVEKFGGCDEYYTEMINSGSLLTRGPFEKYYLLNEIAPEKIVWQLTGKEAESMAKAAAVVSDLGGIGVDINMGCSAPEIVRSGAGIAWMMRPMEETRLMVAGVKNAVQKKNLRLSVKLRLGDENFTDDGFFSFCQMLASEGVQRLVLHPRTRREKLARPIRWEYVERLALLLKDRGVSVVLNGAVTNTDSAKRAMAVAPHSEGIMIARAAAQKPWIFRQLKSEMEHQAISQSLEEPAGDSKASDSSIDMLSLALDFLDYLELDQPQEFWKTRMQRFFSYYCANFSFAHYAQTQMLNATDLDDARIRIAEYIKKVPEDQFLPAPFLFVEESTGF